MHACEIADAARHRHGRRAAPRRRALGARHARRRRDARLLGERAAAERSRSTPPDLERACRAARRARDARTRRAKASRGRAARSSGWSTCATSASRTRSRCRSRPTIGAHSIARHGRLYGYANPERADRSRHRPRARGGHHRQADAARSRGRVARIAPAPAARPSRPLRRPHRHASRSIAGRDLAPGARARAVPPSSPAREATVVVPPGFTFRRRRLRQRVIACSIGRADDDPSHRVRGLQESLSLDRRGDGRHALPHRLLAEHQGAARLLVRGLRRGRRDDRAGRSHARASRRDAAVGARGDRRGRAWRPATS